MSDNSTSLEESFCGDFWNDGVMTGYAPAFTTCFQNTLLVWLPIGWLITALPVQAYILLERNTSHLPLTALSIAKSILCLVLACLVIVESFVNNSQGFHCIDGEKVPPVYYLASAAKVVTFIIVSFAVQYYRRKHVISSVVLFVFWVLLVICELVPLQSNISFQPTCASSIVYYVYFALVFIEFILHCFAERLSKRGYNYLGQDDECPEVNSSMLNKSLFWWLNGLVSKAYKSRIDRTDLWTQTPELKSDNVVPELEEIWKKETQKISLRKKRCSKKQYHLEPKRFQNGVHKTEESPLITCVQSTDTKEPEEMRTVKPSLYKVMLKAYWLEWTLSSILKILCDCVILLQPLLLKEIINFIETKHSPGTPQWKGYALGVLFFVLGEAESLLYAQSGYRIMRLGLKMKIALTGLIYQKALTMTNASKTQYTVGDIVNLMSVDCQRILDGMTVQNQFLSFIFTMSVGLYLVWNEMGMATLGSIVVIIIIAALNLWFGKLQQLYQARILALKSSRMKLLNEVLTGIKVLKMYAWEPLFSDMVLKIRKKEMIYLRAVAIVTTFSVLFSVHSPYFMNFSVLCLYVLTASNNYLNAQKVFVALSVINILRFPLTLIPFVITGVIQMYVSIGRIQNYLWKDDIEIEDIHIMPSPDNAVSIEKGYFTWDRGNKATTLKDINLNVNHGKLIAVVGQVGSGKTSLISALLGEMEKIQGKVQIQGSVAYVPQEAWIQNLTVRENILFGDKFHERKYMRVIECCALLPDLEILAAGDETEIGEKGINVSGGQKQRISLARAVYSNSDVYLMDDPLSAVDSHVGKQLFRKVIGKEGLLKNKTRILVTHGVHWLPMVDEIIVMENGRISEVGSYEQLLKYRGPFAQFLETYLLHADDSDEENDPEISKIKDVIWEKLEAVSDHGISADELISKEGISKRQSARRISLYQQRKIMRTLSSPYTDTRPCKSPSKSNIHGDLQRTKSLSAPHDEMHLVQRSMSEARVLLVDEEPPAEENGTLIKSETTAVGSVKFSVFWAYIKAMGVTGFMSAYLCLAAFQGLNVFGNFWLTFWTDDKYIQNQSLVNTAEYAGEQRYYLGVYSITGVCQGITLSLFAYIGLTSLIRASGGLHLKMLRSVLRSPMSFFDTTPAGRLMNRFSSDIDILDDRMPRTYRLLSIMFFTLFGTIVVISINTKEFLIAVVPVGVLYILGLRYYLPTCRQVRRNESVLRSPVYNHFSETISGAASIRAYKVVDRFVDESRNRVDKNSAFYHTAIAASWWIGIRLEFLGNLLVLAAALFAVISESLSSSVVGLSLTYSMQIIISLNAVVQAVSDMEMNIVSAERVQEYTKLESEAEWIKPDSRPPLLWPDVGRVNFNKYATRYRTGLDLVLRGIDCEISGGEKVGIIGRTGAGKSSLTLSLFRLVEAAGGSITIDGVRISDLGLHDLRSKITILPQDPVLFSGSLKMNLDPSGKYSDDELWIAIERAHLKSFVTSQTARLHYECGEGGMNLSVGQRQLVCLARTLLHKTKILVLDEATAAVDIETDELIQDTIRTEFKECTVLTIAHRLNTVLDYDRIMVLDKGNIVEFDSPSSLLNNRKSVFYAMAKDANLTS